VQLVEDQETQSLRGADELVPLDGASEQVLQHHVVGQENVGLATQDPVACLLVLLPGVPCERDRMPIGRQAPGQELLQLEELAVGQRVSANGSR
jgi:hypothetical protein